MPKYKELVTFGRAQVSAFTGGVCDFLMMIAFTELAGFHYTVSIILSGVLGAVINFTLNRYWAFSAQDSGLQAIGPQLAKFSLVVAGSVLLKSGGTFLTVSFLRIDYRIGRLFIELLVSWGFNFVMQRYWVFREKAR